MNDNSLLNEGQSRLDDPQLIGLELEQFRNGIDGLLSEVDTITSDNTRLRSRIQSVKVFDQVMSHTNLRRPVEEVIRNTVPHTIYIDTPGEYLYGCFYPQDEVSLECTPSCLRGFRNSELITCNFPILEVLPSGKVYRHNQYIGDRAYLFTTDGLITSDIARVITSYGINRVDLFQREGRTIEYHFIDTINLEDLDNQVDNPTDQDQTPTGTTQDDTYSYILGGLLVLLLAASLGIFCYVRIKPPNTGVIVGSH